MKPTVSAASWKWLTRALLILGIGVLVLGWLAIHLVNQQRANHAQGLTNATTITQLRADLDDAVTTGAQGQQREQELRALVAKLQTQVSALGGTPAPLPSGLRIVVVEPSPRPASASSQPAPSPTSSPRPSPTPRRTPTPSPSPTPTCDLHHPKKCLGPTVLTSGRPTQRG